MEDLPVAQPVSETVPVVAGTKERVTEVPVEERVATALPAAMTAPINLAWMQKTSDPY